jgi:hypothetical protein
MSKCKVTVAAMGRVWKMEADATVGQQDEVVNFEDGGFGMAQGGGCNVNMGCELPTEDSNQQRVLRDMRDAYQQGGVCRVYANIVERRDIQIDGMRKEHLDLQDKYRDLFGTINQACKKLELDNAGTHVAVIACVKWITADLLDMRRANERLTERRDAAEIQMVKLASHTNQITAERDRLQAENKDLRAQRDRAVEDRPTAGSQYTIESQDRIIRNLVAEKDRLKLENQVQRAQIAGLERRNAIFYDSTIVNGRLVHPEGFIKLRTGQCIIEDTEYGKLVTAESEKERILAKLKLKSGAMVEVAIDTIQSLQSHAQSWRTHNRDMANGDRLIAKPEYERLREAASQSVRAWSIVDRVARNLGLTDPGIAPEQIMDAISALQTKVATLRNIVQRKAPHVGCVPATDPADRPCTCWKAEFMAVADKE